MTTFTLDLSTGDEYGVMSTAEQGVGVHVVVRVARGDGFRMTLEPVELCPTFALAALEARRRNGRS